VWLYSRTTHSLDRRGHWTFWGLVAFLALVHAANVFGPPPGADLPGPALAAPALAMWLLVAWGYWIDRHRAVPGASPEPSRTDPLAGDRSAAKTH
jgi:hypothetical protein